MSPKLKKSEKMKGKKLDEAGNESTNLNKKFASVRKSLNPNCNSRRILRSSKMLVETEKSCLKPRMSSASSASDGIQQHDVLPAQTINPAFQAIEIVENLTVGVVRGIEKEDEAECSPPSVSLKLSEIVAMVGDNDDSETQSKPEDNDNPYQVKPDYTGMLRKIMAKHGDIAKECLAKSVKYRSLMLENICEVISALENQDITNLKGVENMIDQIKDVKIMKVEVDWLLKRLTEILEARQAFKEGSKLKPKSDNVKEFIEIAESELKECEVEKKELSQKLKEVSDREADWKVRLAKMQQESILTSQKVKDVTSKVKRFLKRSLIDGLL